MPSFTIETLEKFVHSSSYEVEAETVEDAIRMVKTNEVAYEQTLIEDSGDDEFIEVTAITDEYGNDVDVPDDPEPNCTRMIFEIITTGIWDVAAITALADEFQNRYTGNNNIDSACMDEFENVYVEPYVDDNHDDDDD